MRKRIIIFAVLLINLIAYSQSMEIEWVKYLRNDLSASTNLRKDNNGEACALIKVMFPKAGAAFEGNLVGENVFI